VPEPGFPGIACVGTLARRLIRCSWNLLPCGFCLSTSPSPRRKTTRDAWPWHQQGHAVYGSLRVDVMEVSAWGCIGDCAYWCDGSQSMPEAISDPRKQVARQNSTRVIDSSVPHLDIDIAPPWISPTKGSLLPLFCSPEVWPQSKRRPQCLGLVVTEQLQNAIAYGRCCQNDGSASSVGANQSVIGTANRTEQRHCPFDTCNSWNKNPDEGDKFPVRAVTMILRDRIRPPPHLAPSYRKQVFCVGQGWWASRLKQARVDGFLVVGREKAERSPRVALEGLNSGQDDARKGIGVVWLGPVISLYQFEFRNLAALVTANPWLSVLSWCARRSASRRQWLHAPFERLLPSGCTSGASLPIPARSGQDSGLGQAQMPMASAGVVGESDKMLAFATNIGLDVTLWVQRGTGDLP